MLRKKSFNVRQIAIFCTNFTKNILIIIKMRTCGWLAYLLSDKVFLVAAALSQSPLNKRIKGRSKIIILI